MSLKARLETMCCQIDDLLARAGNAGRVTGGYLAGNSILFTLTDTTFPNGNTVEAIRQALGVTAVKATAGAVIVNGWLPATAEVRDGECVSGPDTVGVLDLIEMHQGDTRQRLSPGASGGRFAMLSGDVEGE